MAIASGVSMDQFGRGGYAWTVPADAATGTDYLFRVTSDQIPTVQGTSAAPFTVANSGNLYYVNDGSTTGDLYTSAAGNNANDGKTKATPMASLGALLSAYVMHPGDIIYVDSGNYQVVRNIVLGPNDSGITIEGPGAADVTLNRGNTNSGSYVFELDGATNVTISGMESRAAPTQEPVLERCMAGRKPAFAQQREDVRRAGAALAVEERARRPGGEDGGSRAGLGETARSPRVLSACFDRAHSRVPKFGARAVCGSH